MNDFNFENFEQIYDISWYDSEIFNYRKKKWGLQRIMKFIVLKYPTFDELHLLCEILSVLNENNLFVSRNEVRNCLNQYYRQSEHGDKRSYLNWIYEEFKIKSGGKVR